MVTMHEVEEQLKRIGASFSFFSRPEIRELQHILMPNEQIQACMNGRWSGGWAVLCITNYRVLLIDKKFLYLSLEDVRYDMVVEVDYNYRFLDATINICTPNKTLAFTSYKKPELRKAAVYIQARVMEIRQSHLMHPGQPEPQPEPALPIAAAVAEPSMPTVPQMPMNRIMNPYTQTPFSSKRRISRFYQQ